MRHAEAVDGAGLAPEEHARAIAERLALSPEQAGILVSEVRNALVPALGWAKRGDCRASEGIERVLVLMAEVRRRAR